jgi:DNA-binding IclR family transcriptional regulator
VAVQPAPAVLRACRVLEVLAEQPEVPLGLSEIARRVGIPRASCQTLLVALVQHGLVLRRDVDVTYLLGPACLALGTAAAEANPVVAAAGPALRELSERTGLASVAVVRAADRARAAVVQPGADPFGTTVREGQSVGITAPFGAAFVAWASRDEQERWIASAPAGLGDAGRTQLAAGLAAARRLGAIIGVRRPAPSQSGRANRSARELTDIVVDPTSAVRGRRTRLVEALVRSGYLAVDLDADRRHAVAQISAPVFDERGEVALVLLLAGPPFELGLDEIDGLVTELRSAAADVTRRIRGVPPAPEPPPPEPPAAEPGRPRPARRRTAPAR